MKNALIIAGILIVTSLIAALIKGARQKKKERSPVSQAKENTPPPAKPPHRWKFPGTNEMTCLMEQALTNMGFNWFEWDELCKFLKDNWEKIAETMPGSYEYLYISYESHLNAIHALRAKKRLTPGTGTTISVDRPGPQQHGLFERAIISYCMKKKNISTYYHATYRSQSFTLTGGKNKNHGRHTFTVEYWTDTQAKRLMCPAHQSA